MTRAREVGLMVLTAAVIFFALQNLRPVEVVFLFWHFDAPVALLALLPMLAGLVVGTTATAIRLRQRERRDKAVAGQGEPPALEAQGVEEPAGSLEPPSAEGVEDEEEIVG